jgi:hypothetical protein
MQLAVRQPTRHLGVDATRAGSAAVPSAFRSNRDRAAGVQDAPIPGSAWRLDSFQLSMEALHGIQVRRP